MMKLALAILALIPVSTLASHDGPIYSCSVYVTSFGPGGHDFVDGPYLTQEIPLAPATSARVRMGGVYRDVLRVAYEVKTESVVSGENETRTAELSLWFQSRTGRAGELKGSFAIDNEADSLEVRLNEFGLKGLSLSCSLPKDGE